VSAPIVDTSPGSFAESVVLRRHPAIVERVREAYPYPPAILRALETLDVGRVGGPFLDVEFDFYRRLLDAVGYFGEGPWRGVDPFAPQKLAELAEVPAVPDGLGRAELLHAALLGNRADLGFRLVTASSEGVTVLADDGAALWTYLDTAEPGVVCLVHDNAGTELVADLLLADHLLTVGLATRVELHLKAQPIFVSDATPADLVATVERLRRTAAGQRLWAALRTGALEPVTHPFSHVPQGYGQMPADLTARFEAAKLAIVKGDLNYRRLVEDRHWPVTDTFADRVGYFPCPVAALRTLKSDVVVGLDQATAGRLDRDDPGWRTSGRYAVVQFRG
jgi:hypothetical protein